MTKTAYAHDPRLSTTSNMANYIQHNVGETFTLKQLATAAKCSNETATKSIWTLKKEGRLKEGTVVQGNRTLVVQHAAKFPRPQTKPRTRRKPLNSAAQPNGKMDVKDIVALKDAGFSIDEIIQMKKGGLI